MIYLHFVASACLRDEDDGSSSQFTVNVNSWGITFSNHKTFSSEVWCRCPQIHDLCQEYKFQPWRTIVNVPLLINWYGASQPLEGGHPMMLMLTTTCWNLPNWIKQIFNGDSIFPWEYQHYLKTIH